MKKTIGFGLEGLKKSLWRHHILSGGYTLDMASNGDVVGAEVVTMADQKKAADIADLVPNLIIYEKHGGGRWKRRIKK